MKLVTVKIFDDPIEAHIMKAALENENILCFLFDENIVGIYPLYNITVGGIKLKVRTVDLTEARTLVKRYEKAPLINDEGEVIICPNCKSNNFYRGYKTIKGMKGFLSELFSLIFMVLPISYETVKKCKRCDFEFK